MIANELRLHKLGKVTTLYLHVRFNFSADTPSPFNFVLKMFGNRKTIPPLTSTLGQPTITDNSSTCPPCFIHRMIQLILHMYFCPYQFTLSFQSLFTLTKWVTTWTFSTQGLIWERGIIPQRGTRGHNFELESGPGIKWSRERVVGFLLSKGIILEFESFQVHNVAGLF